MPLRSSWCVLHRLSTIACGVLILVAISYAQNPPRAQHNMSNLQVTVPAGKDIDVPCLVEKESSTIFFQWSKNGEDLDDFFWDYRRFKVLTCGTLHIKAVQQEDSGHYACHAVNGFGSVQVNVTLIVADATNTDGVNKQIGNLFPEAHVVDANVPKAKPLLKQITKYQHSLVHRPAGSSIRFKCKAVGNPIPSITWLKNDQPLDPSLYLSRMKKGRWTILLLKLQESDSGTYSCIVRNSLGSSRANFSLEVVSPIRPKPIIIGNHPTNMTVDPGGRCIFQCEVLSTERPHIKWLKQVLTPGVPQNSSKQLRWNSIEVEGQIFRVLNSSEEMERPDGTFLSKLLIRDVRETQAGKYVCLAANTQGYTYRSTFLTVQLRNRHPVLEEDYSQKNSFPYIIVVIATLTIAVAVVVAVVLYCRCQKVADASTSSIAKEDAFSDVVTPWLPHGPRAKGALDHGCSVCAQVNDPKRFEQHKLGTSILPNMRHHHHHHEHHYIHHGCYANKNSM